MWLFYALLSALFAAVTAILAKVGVTGMDSDLATAIRTGVVMVIAWGIVLFKGSMGTAGTGSLSGQNLLFLCLSGAATGLSWIFYFRALQSGKVSLVAPVDKLSLALTILFSVIFLKETLTLKTLLGVALIIAGTLVLVVKR